MLYFRCSFLGFYVCKYAFLHRHQSNICILCIIFSGGRLILLPGPEHFSQLLLGNDMEQVVRIACPQTHPYFCPRQGEK